jgi:hypothetical protein
MTHALAASLIAMPLMASSAFAADMTPQQRMAACSAQNKGKKGDDYKSSQSACLKNGPTPAAAAPMTPQQRMAMCSAQNKGKKGDDYKQAQSACLKG